MIEFRLPPDKAAKLVEYIEACFNREKHHYEELKFAELPDPEIMSEDEATQFLNELKENVPILEYLDKELKRQYALGRGKPNNKKKRRKNGRIRSHNNRRSS